MTQAARKISNSDTLAEVGVQAIGYGAVGDDVVPVDAAHPLPVTLAAGDVEASGLATEAKQDAQIVQETATAAALGTTAGAKVVTDANGTIQQYLRGIVTFLANALGAGTAAAANRVTLASDDPAVATLGATSGAKVVTDANGTIQQYLRGLVTFFANALGAGTAAASHRVTLASDDPAVATLGATSGAKVVTDANGTIQQYLRGLVSLFASGAALDQTTPGTTNRVVNTQGVPSTFWNGSNSISNSTAAVDIKTAPGANRLYVTGLQLKWPALSGVSEFSLKDGAGGTALFTTFMDATAGHMEVVFASPLRLSVTTKLIAQMNVAVTGGSVYISAQGLNEA